uniref:E3 ubiquitin-protein ligase n=1 Tax=Psilocybe cubensis TaxID=181762 RepID=A0A8H8CS44_PSICU
MSALSSFFPPRRPLSNHGDFLSDLRFSLEIMPGSRKYVFTPAARAEIISKLYIAFMGTYPNLFLPSGVSQVPPHTLLSEYQVSVGFAGAGKEDPMVPGRPCSHIFNKGESCYRCKDCALDDSCVLCSRCFHATDHSTHNVSFFIAQQSGGCCDCGDEEAWRTDIKCPHHPPAKPGDPQDTTPRVILKPLPNEVPPAPNYSFRVAVPPDLKDCMRRTIGFALDFLLDTLDYSPDEPTVPANEADLRLQPSADPMMKDQYCIVLWNDDKHSYDEVTKILIDLTNRTHEDAAALVRKIDEQGREIIDTNSNITRLLETAQAITQIDLGVTVRRAYDTFCEQVVGVIIEWLLDLTRSRLGTDMLVIREALAAELLSPRRRDAFTKHMTPPTALNLDSEIPNATRLDTLLLYQTRLWKRPRLSLKEVYASVISVSRAHKLVIAGHFANIYHRVIDAYLLVDREAETSIKYFALQLFTVPSVSGHIARNHKLVQRLLAIITSFFTNRIVEKRIVYAGPSSITSPPSSTSSVGFPSVGAGVGASAAIMPPATGTIDVDSFPFKSKRFMPVFSDLRYLAHTSQVQDLIAHNPSYLVAFASTCRLFMCLNPNKRAVETHVEYETDAWISVFNVTLSLSRVIKVFGEAFGKSTTAELISAIGTVVHQILMVCTLAEDRLDRTKFSAPTFHQVEFGGKRYNTLQFDVSEGWVSFHHALHWLLAELLKHVDLLGEEELKSVGITGGIREVFGRGASEQAILTIIDFPLRVLAMIAQIRTGLWVRNGFAIRGQLLHYRDYMLRELCYDQDLFILQTALVIIPSDLVIVSILDRFGLLGYFSGSYLQSQYEGTQLGSMVEEVFYVLITILSENANASKMPMHLAIRREIVHALAMGPCSFSDLVKRVAERLVDDPSFEGMLREVANFRPPEGPNETGLYELKDEAYDEVNPFFYHYTRNRREEVENVLRKRIEKRTGKKEWEVVLTPKPFGVTEGPYKGVSDVWERDLMMQIMFYAIWNVLVVTDSGTAGPSPPSAEAILDQALHMIMLGMVERPKGFSTLASKKVLEGKTLIEVLSMLGSHDKYAKLYKARVEWIFSKMQPHIPDEIRRIRGEENLAGNSGGNGPRSAGIDKDEQRKKAAKKRQEAIMLQMKAQQASFASMFGQGMDSGSEDDSDGGDGDSSMVGADGSDEDEEVLFGTCIVCQEDLTNLSAASGKPFGSLGLIQPSRMIRRHPDTQGSYLNEVLTAPLSLDRTASTSPNSPGITPSAPTVTSFPPPQADLLDARSTSHNFEGFPLNYTRFGLHSSVCSHLMHLDCFQVYSVSIRQRHRTQATRNHPECIPRKEFICPLCKSLGNVILPVTQPDTRTQLNPVPFPDWIRAAGIHILKSKPDPLLDSLQSRNGTGEFVFWSAQDSGYATVIRRNAERDRPDPADGGKMLDTVMVISKSISQQTRHLRDRMEPENSERGAGIYLPEELVGYTIAAMEISQRGVGVDTSNLGAEKGTMMVDAISESQTRMIKGLLACLTKLVALQFRNRPDEGRDAVRQAIIKRLLPEWSRSSLTSFSYPLLLRDPFTILVETAAVAPEMLRHVLVLAYYACLARTVIGLVYILNKLRNHNTTPLTQRSHEDIFGDIRMFFMSVVRHSPLFERTAIYAFETFTEARIEKLLYAFTLPFLRRAAILCRTVLPHSFPTPIFSTDDVCEYTRLLTMLDIPPLSDLPRQDTLQNALSGWCAHYGHSHAAGQINCGILLDYPVAYRLARLPLVLDSLFNRQDKALMCVNCETFPSDAAICLICGSTVCLQSSCCIDEDYNNRGECNMHTRECGGTIGIYYCVKRCSVLYLNNGNGTFTPSPYLDAHGEVDLSMSRRGRRQFLHHARWEVIRKTWLSHGIPSMVARKLESSMDSGGWETL